MINQQDATLAVLCLLKTTGMIYISYLSFGPSQVYNI